MSDLGFWLFIAFAVLMGVGANISCLNEARACQEYREEQRRKRDEATNHQVSNDQ